MASSFLLLLLLLFLIWFSDDPEGLEHSLPQAAVRVGLSILLRYMFYLGRFLERMSVCQAEAEVGVWRRNRPVLFQDLIL